MFYEVNRHTLKQTSDWVCALLGVWEAGAKFFDVGMRHTDGSVSVHVFLVLATSIYHEFYQTLL